ncbi:PQQ-binding-like beta-propeller repeat protein [Paraburkholderia youngii]|uniref:outer membrane protein assembly factor BamB family protein n=1 Tax=Paraburkholderia youngii TaxID=2782701 RepID=UPI003D226CAB
MRTDTLHLTCALLFGLTTGSIAYATDWTTSGNDLMNSRNQANESAIGPKTAGALHKLWATDTSGNVTATPALDDSYAYFPDSAGYLYKVDRKTGQVVWKNLVSSYTDIPNDYARATPAISGNVLILGNQSGKLSSPQPAQVFAVDKNTGLRLWHTQVDPTTYSMVTQSAVIANGTAFVGTTSNEELMAAYVSPPAWQWSFRGSVVALEVATGAIKWQTYTMPNGYYGGSVWGSTGAVDVDRNTVFMGSGNNWAVPQVVLDCMNSGGTPTSCIDPNDHFDSILALDMTTGAVKWSARGLPYDTWNVGCGLNVPGVFTLPPNANCPNPQGPDWDFAQGPMLFGGNGNAGRLVGAGQKSGMFWAFDEETGALRWSTQVAPGGLTGGLQWGSANDGQFIYVAVANSGTTGSGTTPGVWQLANGGGTTTSGGWASLNANSGAVKWTTPDPLGSRAEAAVSVANGVVFGCNLDYTKGTMYALDSSNGKVLWSFDSGGACNSGPAVADGVVFWGSGSTNGPGPQKLFAFGL